jgi:acyl-CoA dehydrogenase
MDFGINDELRGLLDQVRDVVESSVLPLEPAFLEGGFAACEPDLRRVREEVKERDLWAPQAPRELGGLGLGLVEFGLVSEQLGRSPLGHYAFGCQAPDAGNIEILFEHGSAMQKQRFLEPLVRGELRSCFAMTEPGHAGSNPTELSSRAVRDGDNYVITGHKWFTSAAEGAAFAIAMVVTDPDASPHRRASQIIVPTDTPGFQLVRNIPIMGDAGAGYASHAEVRFVDCRVPADHLLGDEGSGFAIAQKRLGPGRIHHCMRWIGICERAFEMMVARARSRELGPGKPLAQKQIIQAWIAEARAAINAARLAVLEAAWQIERHGFRAARDRVSLIKFHTAKVMLDTVDKAIQVHGALGITSDTVLAYFYAHERGARIYDGPDEVHKLTAARHLLEPPGENA